MKLSLERGALCLDGAPALRLRAENATVRLDRGALVLEGTPAAGVETDGVALALVHRLRRLSKLHVPHLTPEEGQVAGDFVLRSPAIVLGDDDLALALVADVGDVAALRGARAFLDYDHPARRIVYGAGAYRWEGHVFFRRERFIGSGHPLTLRLHVLASRRPSDVQNPFGMAARFLWRRWGRAAHERGGGRQAPFSTSAAHVVSWAFSKDGWADSVWQSFEIGGVAVAAPVFIVDVSRHPSVPERERRWREPRSVWNQAWFSTQRCANGLYRHARRLGSDELEARARAMTRLALAMPQDKGLFPSVVRPANDAPKWSGAVFSNSDRRPSSASAAACHIVDAAFTCDMLLEWYALTGEVAARDYVGRFVERLLSLQRPSGAFPGWVEPDARVVPELAESPESAVSVALLLRWARLSGAAGALDAAKRGLAFLEAVAKDGRWEDFETYWSCAPWGRELLGQRVPRNGVYKSNTLSMAWTAEAMRRAHRAFGDRRYLSLALRCAGELSLYQAVWDPRFLPARAHGGFGVMNADSEWNDARQSLFAPLYLDLYRATGDGELFERGVAALRASFSMLYAPENEALRAAYEERFPFFGRESYGFMMENQGHGEGHPIGTFTIYTWGNGSALAAAASVWDRYGDVYVDPERRRAFAVDVTSVEVSGARVHVVEPFDRPSLTIAVEGGRRRTLALRRGRGSFALPR